MYRKDGLKNVTENEKDEGKNDEKDKREIKKKTYIKKERSPKYINKISAGLGICFESS